ncbi:unnamed protein product [Mytilus edulis]|uniref:C2H2-type domain-containing protein n=1 Tax=Mytilus edulis TaxID=6550 RepID=A0A8S3R5F9_MYTED|nr:unnamed protein product [Mytilus edulis]
METVNMYHLRDDGVALIVYKSRCHYDNTMHVNKFDHYLSYISNLVMYTQKYQCGTCDRHFKHLRNMKRHQLTQMYRADRLPLQKADFIPTPKPSSINWKNTASASKIDYTHGSSSSISRPCWCPCKNQIPPSSPGRSDTNPISISVCSNVEGFTERRFFADPDGQSLVQHMVDYMSEISNKAYELTRQKFADPFHQLDADIQNPYRALLEDDDEDEYKLDAFLDDTELLEEIENQKTQLSEIRHEFNQDTLGQNINHARTGTKIHGQTQQQLRLFGQ